MINIINPSDLICSVIEPTLSCFPRRVVKLRCRASQARLGTTRHIAPHQYQIDGDAKRGVPALRWTEGDDVGNLKALIEVSVANLINLVPGVSDARYDFQSGTFRTGEGKPVTDGVLDGWGLVSERNRAASAGRSTLKRGILLNTLARAEVADRPGLLERALRQSRQLVRSGGLARTFYMRDSAPVASLTGDELGAWEDIRQLGKKAEKWYRDNLIGKTVVMESTGWAVQFSRAGSKKVTGRKGDIILRAIPALESIIAKSILKSSEPGSKPGTEQLTFHKVEATVEIEGQTYGLSAIVRESANGKYHYDLSLDYGIEGSGFPATGQVSEARSSQAGTPDTLNLEFAPSEINTDAPITDETIRSLTKELNAMPELSRLAGRVNVRVVRSLIGRKGGQIQGRADGSQVSVRAGATAGERGVARHEIIHVLRNGKLWGTDFGLFTEAEWQGLVRAARAKPGIVAWVKENYGDLDGPAQAEEMVAELYRLWANERDGYTDVEKALLKIEAFLMAVVNALRGRGFVSEARTLEAIATGAMGGRGPQGPGGPGGGRPTSGGAEMREGGVLPSGARRKFRNLLGSAHWKNVDEFASNALTDAMAGNNGYNALALVPGRALFSELGKRLMSAKTYLRAKEEMDALRNDWHSRADEVSQVWRKARNKDPRANDELMDLMHRSTLTGVDPSKADTWKHGFQTQAEREVSRLGDQAPKWAQDVLTQVENHKRSYATLKARYDALPEDMKAIYRDVRAQYDKLGDEFEKAVLENIEAGLKVAIKRAQKAFRKEMERIKDEGLQGDEKAEAVEKAQATLDAVKARGGWGAKAKIASLRKQFESNKLKGPYFPLARFGQFFVTIRNAQGEVTSFSRFEKESQQQAFIREQKEAGATNIRFGVMSEAGKLREQVDPAFVADVEGVLADAGASDAVMDAIWQRWLETLPDTSIRTAKIHRKGREGWNKDAFRAFGSHMFHGAHQLARLKYGLELEEALNDAEDEARVAEDPNRAGLIVNEMRRRHEFTMNPMGSSIVAGLSSLSFIWYLGATPAAALANISQTTVMGPGIMAARFKQAGITGAAREIGRAMKDFTKGRGDVQKAPGITQDEHAAITEAYRRGTIDRTQAHDLASVAETGIEYNATRENIMRKISWMFHQAERMNREVTFLANYRLARAEGLRGDDAIDAAADVTWKVHFDYQASARPRFMQSDMGKVLTIFRQYSVNLAYRIFRDAHQSLRGATKEERAEARTQLVGVTLSMMAHAGIKGTYGYGIVMLLLSMFFPGDGDDLEEWLQDALLMEGDSTGVAAWNYAMGAALNGVPGQILGADLSERVGSPNIWFRGPSSDLEGEDVVMHYVTEFLGPPLGIVLGIGRGIQRVTDGEVYRGIETAVPKMVRDIMKAGRYGAEGVETLGGDDILPDVNPYQLLMQASGFTPAEVSERFDMNTRLKNKEREIMDERKGIHKAAVDAILAGEALPESVLEDIRDFNTRFPEYPITSQTIRQSAQGRQRAQQQMEGGVSLNKRLSERLREGLATPVYQ